MLIDGHLFYNNKCIKLRYDLLKQEKSSVDYAENQVFDYYDYPSTQSRRTDPEQNAYCFELESSDDLLDQESKDAITEEDFDTSLPSRKEDLPFQDIALV